MHHDDNDALENTSDLCNNLPGWQWHCQKESGSGFSFLAKKKLYLIFSAKIGIHFWIFLSKKKWKREKTIFTTFSENKEKQKEKIWEKMKLKNMEKTEKIIGKNVWK